MSSAEGGVANPSLGRDSRDSPAHLDAGAERAVAEAHASALTALEAGDVSAAATLLLDVIEAEPFNADFRNDLGAALSRMGRYHLAHQATAQALAVNPAHPEAGRNMVLLKHQLAPTDILFERASAALARGELDAAEHFGRACIDALNDHVPALCLIGRIALARGDKLEATRWLIRALEQSLDDPLALSLLDEANFGLSVPLFVLPAWRSRPPRQLASRPLVSLTLGSFNNEPFIREAVESALAQDYEPLEIIITDDASTDATPRIIAACVADYAGPHDVSFIPHERNLGSRGRGNWIDSYRRTKGRFVIQFSGDDVMYPNMVSEMVKVWIEQSVSLVTVNARCINGAGNPLGRYLRDPDAAPNDSLEALLRDGGNDCCFGAGMGYDREVHELFPFTINNPPLHLGAQDIMFPFYAGLLRGARAIPQPLMDYRIHGQQFSLSAAHELAQDALRRLIVEERIYVGHMAHAMFQKEVLNLLTVVAGQHFGPIAEAFETSWTNQLFIMAKREIDVRKQLFYDHAIAEMSDAR